MERRKRILSVICALCILVTGYSNLLSYVTFAGTQTYTLTASDGNTYKITVSYDEASGIPDDAELVVREILDNEEPNGTSGSSDAENTNAYDEYVGESARVIGETESDVKDARVFDISLVNPSTGVKYQPNNAVNVSIELLDTVLDNNSCINVVHLAENESEVLSSKTTKNKIKFKTESFSVFVVLSTTLKQKLTASDGKEYLITVTYDDSCGIPKNAELVVSEIKKNDDSYEEYVTSSSERLGRDPEDVLFAHAFDIKLRNPKTGEEYQPTKDVRVSIQLLKENLNKFSKVNVVHYHGNADGNSEVMNASINGEAVEFRTSGFSVYVVISHIGDTITTPRVEFHYIDPNYTENTETIDNGDNTTTTIYTYTAPGYKFINKKNEEQITQILKDGETLELIENPPNKKDSNGNEASFFYGWYTVNMSADTTGWSSASSSWTGTITYTWPNPQKVEDETPISIIANDANGDGKITGPVTNNDTTTYDTVTWTIGNTTGTAELDAAGTAHVYLVPVYEDFYFINFHMGNKEADPGLRNNLLIRRLVVFGTSTTASVRIGDVICPSPDPSHQIFSGWETVANNSGTLETVRFYETVDENQNEIANPSGRNGYYITVTKAGSAMAALDLYPVFAEARWLYYDLGKSGNGAVYLPAAYRLTNDDNKGTYFNSLSVTTRPGYDFGGWYVNAAMVGSEIKNLNDGYDTTITETKNGVTTTTTTHYTQAIQLTDANGAFVNGANGVMGKVFYALKSEYGKETTAGEGTSNVTVTRNSKIYMADAMPAESDPNNPVYIKLFEITSEGKLYFYKDIDSLTVSAKWNPKTVKYTVVYWLENANDDNYTLMYYKVLTGTAGAQTNAQEAQTGDTFQPEGEGGTVYHPYTEYKMQFAHLAADQDKDKNGDQNGIQQQEIEGDGSTIVNVYYDRNRYTLRFDIGYSTTSGSGSTTDYEVLSTTDAASYNGTVYGYVNGALVTLTRGISGYTYSYSPTYTASTAQEPTMYGIVNGQYVQLDSTPVNGYGYTYTQYETAADNEGTQYALVDGEYVPVSYEVVGSTTTWTVQYTYTPANNNSAEYGIYNHAIIQLYRNSGRWYRTRTQGWFGGYDYSDEYTGTRYTRSNSGSYSGTRYTTPDGSTEYTGTTGTAYGRNGTTIYQLTPATTNVYGWRLNGADYTGNRYKKTTSTAYTGQRYTKSGSVYTATTEDATSGQWGVDSRGGHVELTGTTSIIGYTYTANGEAYTGTRYTQSSNSTVYTGTRYSDSNCMTATTSDEGTQYGKDDNGVIFQLTQSPVYKWTYTDLDNATQTYTGTLYKQVTKTGTTTYYVSYITNSNNYNDFLTGSRANCGTTIPSDFIPCGRRVERNGTTDYTIYYYDLTAKYGERIDDRWPDLQPDRPNNYAFIGWIAHPYSYYWKKINTSSIKSKYTVMDEGIISVDRNNNNNYTSITAENGITHELRCRYQNTNIRKYFYRIYYWDPVLNDFPTTPNIVLPATSQGVPSNQAVPSYTGYTEPADVVKKVITGNENNTPQNISGNDSYSAYAVSYADYNAMIMCYYYRPNLHHINYKYGSGAPSALVNTTFDTAAKDYYYNQSLADANVNQDAAVADTPLGHTFAGWYENPDGVGKPFNFNSTMPDGDIMLYAVYKPVKFRVQINPNGAEIDHIDHTGAAYHGTYNGTSYNHEPFNRDDNGEREADHGYNRSQATYINGTYGEKVGEYAVSRNHVPISDSAAAVYTGRIYYISDEVEVRTIIAIKVLESAGVDSYLQSGTGMRRQTGI